MFIHSGVVVRGSGGKTSPFEKFKGGTPSLFKVRKSMLFSIRYYKKIIKFTSYTNSLTHNVCMKLTPPMIVRQII